jgi:manganese/zinc/iron transport system substrate-binding protein
LIFYGGLNLEGKMGEIFAKMGSRVETVPVGDAVPVEERLDFPGYAGFSDPHIWFDVSYWSLGAQRIADTLARVDPDGAPDFQARAKTLLEQLAALDGWIKESILTIPASQRVLITSHDAFRYYGRRYGLEVVGLQGISTDAEASAEDVRKLAELIVTRKLPSIFIETSVPQRTIEAVQAAAENAGQAVKIGGTLPSWLLVGEPSRAFSKSPAGTGMESGW